MLIYKQLEIKYCSKKGVPCKHPLVSSSTAILFAVPTSTIITPLTIPDKSYTADSELDLLQKLLARRKK